MTVTSVAVAKTKFLNDTCDCTVHSDVGTSDFSFALGILVRVWTSAHAIARVSGHGMLLGGGAYKLEITKTR